MVIRLVHEVPHLLAGAAVIGATQPVESNFAPKNPQDEPVPIMFIHGTRDPIVPYEGGMASMWGFNPRGIGLSAVQTAHYYARRNGITADPVREHITPARKRTGTAVEAVHYRQPGHAPVSFYAVHRGGHTIPRHAQGSVRPGTNRHGLRHRHGDRRPLRAARQLRPAYASRPTCDRAPTAKA
ncbi:hypothetical protein [Streptomyces sp. NPDC127190]|uniref:hypothetical protein n=1 Tax=unclassified Streptomyces TaxID=2593676 RepID=UPI003639A46D